MSRLSKLLTLNPALPASRSSFLTQKGFASVIAMVLLLAGIGVGTYLVQQRTNYLPKASTSNGYFVCTRTDRAGICSDGQDAILDHCDQYDNNNQIIGHDCGVGSYTAWCTCPAPKPKITVCDDPTSPGETRTVGSTWPGSCASNGQRNYYYCNASGLTSSFTRSDNSCSSPKSHCADADWLVNENGSRIQCTLYGKVCVGEPGEAQCIFTGSSGANNIGSETGGSNATPTKPAAGSLPENTTPQNTEKAGCIGKNSVWCVWNSAGECIDKKADYGEIPGNCGVPNKSLTPNSQGGTSSCSPSCSNSELCKQNSNNKYVCVLKDYLGTPQQCTNSCPEGYKCKDSVCQRMGTSGAATTTSSSQSTSATSETDKTVIPFAGIGIGANIKLSDFTGRVDSYKKAAKKLLEKAKTEKGKKYAQKVDKLAEQAAKKSVACLDKNKLPKNTTTTQITAEQAEKYKACSKEANNAEKPVKASYRLSKFYEILDGKAKDCVKADFGVSPLLYAEGVGGKNSGSHKKLRIFLCRGDSDLKWRVQSPSNKMERLEALKDEKPKYPVTITLPDTGAKFTIYGTSKEDVLKTLDKYIKEADKRTGGEEESDKTAKTDKKKNKDK